MTEREILLTQELLDSKKIRKEIEDFSERPDKVCIRLEKTGHPSIEFYFDRNTDELMRFIISLTKIEEAQIQGEICAEQDPLP